MVEGFDYDDKYRMVEDEFFSVAQKFTVHLHVAEYKRQQKMAKSRNAETINSISRPVTGKMPEQTKRKLDSIHRTKKQNSALEGLIGKKGKSGDMSDESDDEKLPYVGTTLHGLMDSPRRKAVSLSRLGKIPSSTRSAAGFKNPSTFKSPQKSQKFQSSALSLSPRSKKAPAAKQLSQPKDDSTTDTSTDDDDLNVRPILAPKLKALEKNSESSPAGLSKIHQIKPERRYRKAASSPTMSSKPPRIKLESLSPKSEPKKLESAPNHAQTSSRDSKRVKKSSPKSSRVKFEDIDEFQPIVPRSSRLERTRLKKETEEKEQKTKIKVDIIPTFM